MKFKDLLIEVIVPMGISLKKWKSMQDKGMTAKQYHKENPSTKFWIAHAHKKGSIGEPVKGSENKSYNEVSKMHKAIEMSKHR
jgi:hypothetical protein